MSLSNTLSSISRGYSPLSSPTTVIPSTKAPKVPGQKNLGGNKGAGQKPRSPIPTNPFDAFTVAAPYDPTKISGLAQTGYNQDVTQAQTLSGMGFLTPAQIDAQSQNRATQQTALGASLAAALGSIQQAYVGQGNASGAALGGQNQQAFAGSDRALSESGVAPQAPPNLQALLGSQTAAGANIYGADQAGALAAGSENARQAYATGETTKQTNQADQQKTLAQLLSGIASPTARSASMTDANAKVDAANKATELSIYTGIENRRLTAQAMGDKKAEAAAGLAEKKLEANMSSADRRYVADEAATTSTSNNANTNAEGKYAADLAAKTKRDVAAITARAKAAGKTHGLTPSQALSLSKQIVKIRTQTGGQNEKSPTGYKISYTPPLPTGPGGVALPGAKPPANQSFSVSAKDYTEGGWKSRIPKGAKFLGSAPQGSSSAKVNASSEWTRYKEALGTVMQTLPKLSRTDAVHYLGDLGWKAPKSGGK